MFLGDPKWDAYTRGQCQAVATLVEHEEWYGVSSFCMALKDSPIASLPGYPGALALAAAFVNAPFALQYAQISLEKFPLQSLGYVACAIAVLPHRSISVRRWLQLAQVANTGLPRNTVKALFENMDFLQSCRSYSTASPRFVPFQTLLTPMTFLSFSNNIFFITYKDLRITNFVLNRLPTVRSLKKFRSNVVLNLSDQFISLSLL